MLRMRVLAVAGLTMIIAAVLGFAHGFPAGTYYVVLSCGAQNVWVGMTTVLHNNLAPPPGFAAQGFPTAAGPPNVFNNGSLSCTPTGLDWEPIVITITPHPAGPNRWTGVEWLYSCPPASPTPNKKVVDPVALGVWYGLICPSTGITHASGPGAQGDAQIRIVESPPVPTLTQWGLLALGLLLAGSLAFMIRRRFAPRPAGA
jgi:hypothetical protein